MALLNTEPIKYNPELINFIDINTENMSETIQYSKEVLAAIGKINSAIAIRKELREELSKKENEAREARLVWKVAMKTCENLKEFTLPLLLSEFNIGDKVLVKNGKKNSLENSSL